MFDRSVWPATLYALALSAAMLTVGCDDGDGAAEAVVDATADQGAVSADQGVAPDANEAMDAAAQPDMGADAAVIEPDVCDTEGLERRAFREGTGEHFGDIAGDFTVNTLNGPWTLSTAFSGCESYVFIVYIPDLRQNGAGAWVGDQVWESDVAPLLAIGAPNTQYFFVSLEAEPTDRMTRVSQMRERVDLGLGFGQLFPEDRVHFVTDRLTEIEGSVGAFASDYMDYLFDPASVADLGDRGMAQPPLPFAFGIDRLQRWDSGGSLNEVVGAPMRWKMAAFFGRFYNHIERTYAQADDGATEVVLLDERVSSRIFTPTVTLPDAAQMAAFDTVEVDVSVTCPHRNVFACSEWDRIARIEVCLDAECAERRELARWITPYWRRGERRWIWDASAFRGWLADGGEQTFRIEMGPEWERATERDTRIALRFRTTERPKATAAELAFTGGSFGADYNTREPFTFTPPADATRVELVVLLSGHGQTDGDNCAEWCDHRHQFSVNGTALPAVQHEGSIGSRAGCAEFADHGVSPGQFGNWAPERAFWCPGLPVAPIHIDLTAEVTLGAENQLEYSATLGQSTAPRGGDIALSAYVVYSR